MVGIYISVWKKGVIYARHFVKALDEQEAERLLLRQYPQYAGMSLVCESGWK